jgi:transglutaminase-like putative cysteine protease
MIRYAIRHITHFRYAAPVRFARCNLRLKPIDWDGQRVETSELVVTPKPFAEGARPSGYLANVTRIILDKPSSDLVIDARVRLVVDRVAPVALDDDPTVGEVAAAGRNSIDPAIMSPASYLFPTSGIPLVAAITDYCAVEFRRERGIVEAGIALSKRIMAEFRYDGSATQVDTMPGQAFEARAGVCQDFAQIMIAGLRGLGLPAAYVSGYLRTLPPPGKPRLVGADATHAWVLLWCGPERGWLGFDPTNGVTMGADHIVTAIGRDYADVAPIDGVFVGRDGQDIDVSVDVEPLDETAAAA